MVTTNVVGVESELPWEELAEIPELYSTAWTCLHRNLDLSRGQTLDSFRGSWRLYGHSHGRLPDDPAALSMDGRL